jgi:hypothetical protein
LQITDRDAVVYAHLSAETGKLFRGSFGSQSQACRVAGYDAEGKKAEDRHEKKGYNCGTYSLYYK